jgi:hypothetical protein
VATSCDQNVRSLAGPGVRDDASLVFHPLIFRTDLAGHTHGPVCGCRSTARFFVVARSNTQVGAAIQAGAKSEMRMPTWAEPSVIYAQKRP